MSAIVERHIVEQDVAAADLQLLRIRRVPNARHLVMDRDKLLHVVDRALQVVDVHADVAQIAVDDEVARQHIGHVAGRRLAGHPQQQCAADHRGAHAQQHQQLDRAGERVAHPCPAHALAPFADDACQPPVLALLRAEGFHHRVAGQRVGERAADLGVPGVRQPRGRRDVERRERHRHGNVGDRAEADDKAERGPVQRQQHGRARQHHERRQQRQQDRVVEQIDRPHAARDLAHRRAREAVRVPVGGEALHEMKRIARNVRHHLQREGHDAPEAEMAQRELRQAERDDRRERPQRAGLRRLHIGRAQRHRIDQLAGIERHEHVGDGRADDRQRQSAAEPWLVAPVAEHEGKHHADRRGAASLNGHCIIRLRRARGRLHKDAADEVRPAA